MMEATAAERAFPNRGKAISTVLILLGRRAGWKELADKVCPTARKVHGEEAEAQIAETFVS